tara:strand:- start:3911 stop:6169 length:2259 start_codon:yes stop_codon:yes gene_type:complete
MPRITQYQSNFTIGEVDPLLFGRVDLQQYPSALEKAQNVVVIPQGGFERRPGTRFMLDITSHLGGSFTTLDGIRLIPFEFSTTQSYMLVFVKYDTTNTRMFVFANAQQITNINGSGNNYLTCALGNIDLDRLYFTQSADTLILVHEDMSPKSIVRGDSNSSWTFSTISLTSPKTAFTTNTTNPSATLTPDSVDGTVSLTASATIWHDGRSGTAQAGASATITLDSGASATNDIYNGATITTTGGTGSGQTRIISDYVGSSKVATVSVAWSTTPSSDTTFTIVSQVDQYINVLNGFGRAKIVAVSSGTVAKVVTEFPFFEKDVAIASGDWELESGYEDAVSSSRGYFRTCTFHEGRLYMGGSKSLPNSLFGSKINNFFNFKPAESLDDDAIFVTIATDSVNAITAMRSGRDLQLFTKDAEFFVPQATLDPITPSNIVIKNATRRGSKEGIKPVMAEGGTLFIQREGKALREFLFSDVDLNYQANNISLLASHLLKGPRSMALRVATSTDDGDLLLITNDDDGSIGAFSILRSQNVVAPSEFTTNGKFLDVAVDVTDIYTVTERTINSSTKRYVELFDDQRTTDCNIQYFSGATSPDQSLPTNTTCSSLSHLEGASVDVIRDNYVLTDKTVASGAITIDAVPSSFVEVGLSYSVEVKTLPAEPRLPSGPVVSRKKRILEATPVLNSTQNLAVNGFEIPFETLPYTLSSTPKSFTGRKRIAPLLGYSDTAQITFTMTQPLFATVLSVEYKLSTGQ